MELDINGVTFGYSNMDVLKNLWIGMDGPQLVSILGPNGVGKSTLITCLCKILKPQQGTVFLDGRDLEQINIKELAKEVGYVPVSTSDSFPMNVVDAVLMGRQPYSKWRTDDEDLEKVYDVLKRLDITHLAMRQFNELSAGQHQKVVLARGLVQEPRILLLDEPTSNLDIRHQIEVTRLLKELSREKNMLIIMISHDINIAARYSDNVIMMYQGGIFSAGHPWDVITEENVRTVYGVNCKVVDFKGNPHVILDDTTTLGDDESWTPPYSEDDHPTMKSDESGS